MDIEKKLSSSLADVISYEKKKDNKNKNKGKMGLNKKQVNGKKAKRGMTFYQGQQNKDNGFNPWRLKSKRQSVPQLRAIETEGNVPKKHETRVMNQEPSQRVKRTNDDRKNKLILSTRKNVEKKKLQRLPRNVIQSKRLSKNLKTFSNTTLPSESFDSTRSFAISSSKNAFSKNDTLTWRQMNQKLNLVGQPELRRNEIIFSQSPNWRTPNDFVYFPNPFTFRSGRNLSSFNDTSFDSVLFPHMKMLPKQQAFPQVLPIPFNHWKRKKRFNSSFNQSLPFLTPTFGIKTRKEMSGQLFF